LKNLLLVFAAFAACALAQSPVCKNQDVLRQNDITVTCLSLAAPVAVSPTITGILPHTDAAWLALQTTNPATTAFRVTVRLRTDDGAMRSLTQLVDRWFWATGEPGTTNLLFPVRLDSIVGLLVEEQKTHASSEFVSQ